MSDQQEQNALAQFFNAEALPWADGALIGTALALPDAYKSFTLKGELHIEYLQIGSTNAEGGAAPNKNHVVFRLPFAQFQTLRFQGRANVIYGARVSMDLTDDESLKKIDKDRLESDYDNIIMAEDFYPGTLYVKLLPYESKSLAANKVSKFSTLNVATLGDFIDFIKHRKIHEMSFVGYGEAWKGCRDFITQTFVQLRTADKISEFDDEGCTFMDNITKVHHKNSSDPKLVDCGKFLNYAPIYLKGVYEGAKDDC